MACPPPHDFKSWQEFDMFCLFQRLKDHVRTEEHISNKERKAREGSMVRDIFNWLICSMITLYFIKKLYYKAE